MEDKRVEQLQCILMTAQAPAYRIETERLVIRCWSPMDASLLKDAIDSSLDHLRPWMPWAENEPEALNAKIERLRKRRGQFDLNQDFFYGIFSSDETRVIGGTGLHTREGADILEIGYWVRSDSINRGFVTEVSAALTRVGFEVDQVARVEIRCEPKNIVSATIPRKLGFVHEKHRSTPTGRRVDDLDDEHGKLSNLECRKSKDQSV